MTDDLSEPKGAVRLPWDAANGLLAFVRGDADQDEAAEVVQIDRATGNRQTCRLNVPYPLHIAGLARASDRHVLVGLRNTVVCVDIAKMRETCRAREVNSQAGPGEEDAVDEETLC